MRKLYNKHTLFIGLSAVVFYVFVPMVRAEITAFYDFESGVDTFSTAWSAYHCKYRPVILTDSDGNHFYRITATTDPQDARAGDPNDPLKIRCQAALDFVSTEEGVTNTVSWSMRVNQSPPGGTIWMELFQYGNAGLEPIYGTPGSGTGPTVWISGGAGSTGNYTVRNYYNNGNDIQEIELGNIPVGKWVNMAVQTTWSLYPSVGRVDVWQDGVHMGTLSGAPTIYSDISYLRAQMMIGFYGSNSYGVVDYDNIKLETGPPTTTPAPAPTSSPFRSHLPQALGFHRPRKKPTETDRWPEG